MRRRIHQVTLLVVMGAMLSMLWPTPAHAQRHVHGHPAVYAHGGYGGPYFYYPGIYYSGFYGWYGYPWAPWGPWGPWPAYGYYDNTSSARIQGAPPEADVYVDGYYAGTVDDFDGTFQRLRVPPGEHELVIYLEGYKPTRQSILFRPGAGYKINTTLEKLGEGEHAEPRPTPAPDVNKENAPAPPSGRRAPDRGEPAGGASVAASGFGTLAVRVQPAGASVLIDGERWEGPESGERLNLQLADGRHRVEVLREGYQPYATDVEVRSGQTASLNVSLPQERR